MTNITVSINTSPTEIPTPIQLYMHREDKDVLGGVRSCASCPAVYTLKDDPHVVVSQQWQYYIRAINYNMTLDDTYLLLDNGLAFANGTGFRNNSDPRADYFHRRDLSFPPPNLDKVRTCSRSVLTGVEQYSLVMALKRVQSLAKSFLWAGRTQISDVRAALVSKNVLKVQTFDSTKPPPLRQGRTYPTRIEDVDPTDYLIMPQTNREMFLVANIVNPSGELSQFPRGATYNWIGDGAPYSFMPHISNSTYGNVLYPLDYLYKLPLGSPIPSPYRRS